MNSYFLSCLLWFRTLKVNIVLDIAHEKIAFCLSLLAIVTIASTVAAVYGFARGAEEARTAVNQFEKGSLNSIDGNKPPPCPLADKQDDYCDGWKDGWEKTVVEELD
jgi:hypothetical protein